MHVTIHANGAQAQSAVSLAISTAIAARVSVLIRCPWDHRQIYRDTLAALADQSMEYSDGSALYACSVVRWIVQVVPDKPIEDDPVD